MGKSKELFTEMRAKSLYNITLEQQILMNEIELMDGELSEENEKELEINKKDLEHKSIAYLAVIREKESENNLIDSEIKRLQALKKRNSNILKRLQYNLLNAVKTFGSYEIGFNKFGTRKSTSVEITDLEALPLEFQTEKTTFTPNKTLIKETIKNGGTVKGAEIKENLNLKIN